MAAMPTTMEELESGASTSPYGLKLDDGLPKEEDSDEESNASGADEDEQQTPKSMKNKKTVHQQVIELEDAEQGIMPIWMLAGLILVLIGCGLAVAAALLSSDSGEDKGTKIGQNDVKKDHVKGAADAAQDKNAAKPSATQKNKYEV